MLSPETKPYSENSVLGTQYSVLDRRPDQLTGRLDQLRDANQLAAAISEALRLCGAAAPTIDSIHITYCKIKPGRDINAAFDIHVRWPCGETQRLAASGTLWGSARRGQKHFEDDAAMLDVGLLAGRPELARFDRVTAYVSEMAMQLRLFPADPVLHGLAPATDAARIRELLRRELPACRDDGWQPREVRYTPQHYKPKRSCTLRYTALLEHPNGDARSFEFYGKVYRDDRAEYCHRWLHESYEAARVGWVESAKTQHGTRTPSASEAAWRAAAPIAFVPEWNFVLQSSVAGRQFRHLFADLTHDNATDSELAQVEHYVRAIACAIRSVQSGPVRFGPVIDFGTLLASQANNLAYLRRWHADLADRVARVRDELARLEPTIPANPPVLAHGDFAHGNVLVESNQPSAISDQQTPPVGVIDFDRAGQAEPAYDVAYFLTHVWSFGVRHPRRMPHVVRLYEAFRRAYLAIAPEVSPRRLALYEALDFTAYVLRNFRKQSHQPNWLAWAEAQVDAAFDRLTLAAGGKEVAT
jgi:aminoglycoside phosphotransferase (APT) family kinase protein